MNYTQSEEYLFNTMPVGRAIASLAVPTVISQIITVIYNMADTFFVGQLGDPNQVAAATVALPLFIFITALANLFGVGGASLISRCLGQGDRQKAGHTAAFCIWSAIAVSLIYGIAVLLLRPVLLPLLGADAETFGYSSSYVLYSIGLGAMPAALNPMLAHLVRAEGHSRQASLGVAFGGILNILLDPFFIFVLDLEIAGAGVATLLSNLAAAGYFMLFLHKIRHETAITISPRQYTLGQHIPGEVLSVGLPSCLISVMGAISNTVLNHFTSGYSNAAMAGMGIAKKVNLLAFAVGQGITQGTLPLIGYNYTSGNRQRMLKTIYGLLKPKTGDILYKGSSIKGMRAHKIVEAGLAHVPEGRHVFLHMTVEENLDMGAYTQPASTIAPNKEKVFELFPRLKERRKQLAGTMSGGEQQMLAMGRALMSNASMLMLDEPSMGLSPLLVQEIFDIIQNVHKEGMTILLVEQNAQMALSVADRAYVLETGRVVMEGTGAELLTNERVRSAYLGG